VRNSHGFSSRAAYPAAHLNVYHEGDACRKTGGGIMQGKVVAKAMRVIKAVYDAGSARDLKDL
jgi:hypothetical protein